MRKLYHHLLTALLAFAGTTSALAQADDWSGKAIKSVVEAATSLDQLTDGGFYLMRNVGRATYINEQSNGLLYLSNLSGLSTSPTTELISNAFFGVGDYMNYVVKLVKITDGNDVGKYKIQVQSGKYLGALPGGGNMNSSESAEPFTIEKFAAGTNTFHLAGTSNDCWLNGNGANDRPGSSGTLTGWVAGDASSDGNNNAGYQFYPVTLADLNLTYNLKYNGATISTKYYFRSEGGAYPKPYADGSYYTITGYKDGTMGASAETIDLTLNAELPFTVSSSVSDATWFGMKVRTKGQAGGQRWLTTSNDGLYVSIPKNNAWVADVSSFNAYANVADNIKWCVTGDPYNGFRFYNRLKGQYLAKPSSTTDGTNVALTAQATDATKIEVYYNAASTAGSPWFLKFKDTDIFISNFWGANATELKIYNGENNNKNDDGSAFKFIPAEELPELTAANIPTTNLFSGFDFDKAKASTETGEALFNASTGLSIDANSFYKIYCVNILNKRYIGSASITTDTEGKLTGEGTPIAREGDGGTLTKLWRFEKNEETGKYLIRNANTGRPIGQWTSNGAAINMLPTTTDEQWAGAFTMEQGSFGITTWILKEQGHQLNAFKGNASDIISNWEQADDKGGNWYIERVTEIPLAITAAKWASATYPFGVQLPEALTAYVATAVDGAKSSVTLTAIGQAIPANTPVFITLTDKNGTAGNYTATIDNSISTLNGQTNLLSGSTARRSGFEESTIYGLAAGTDGATLKLNAEAAVPANKAYLQASEVNGSNVQTLHFSFGDVTGIGGITTGDSQQADDTYYDLSGRRVLYPAHGVFVKANGQKVYIK